MTRDPGTHAPPGQLAESPKYMALVIESPHRLEPFAALAARHHVSAQTYSHSGIEIPRSVTTVSPRVQPPPHSLRGRSSGQNSLLPARARIPRELPIEIVRAVSRGDRFCRLSRVGIAHAADALRGRAPGRTASCRAAIEELSPFARARSPEPAPRADCFSVAVGADPLGAARSAAMQPHRTRHWRPRRSARCQKRPGTLRRPDSRSDLCSSPVETPDPESGQLRRRALDLHLSRCRYRWPKRFGPTTDESSS
jgi:hypothetical protein